jgi:membrane protease YdiL (CAAX protease family)
MSLPTDQQPPDPPWGPASTVVWTMTAILLSLVVASALYSIWADDGSRSSTSLSDGVMLTFGTFISVPVQLGVVLFAAQLRRWPPAIYLGLVPPRRAEVILAVACIVVLGVAFDGVLYLAGREIVPDFQVKAWQTAADAGWLSWMLLAIVVVAPIGEEVVFRGFLYRGLAKPGWEVHAIGGIALAWALLHIQYDWLGMAQIFLLGLALGWFRWASGSTLLTIGMHILINLESMIETWIKVEYFS